MQAKRYILKNLDKKRTMQLYLYPPIITQQLSEPPEQVAQDQETQAGICAEGQDLSGAEEHNEEDPSEVQQAR